MLNKIKAFGLGYYRRFLVMPTIWRLLRLAGNGRIQSAWKILGTLFQREGAYINAKSWRWVYDPERDARKRYIAELVRSGMWTKSEAREEYDDNYGSTGFDWENYTPEDAAHKSIGELFEERAL